MKPFANPARSRIPKNRRVPEFYPYYAGFSSDFADDALGWLAPLSEGIVLDPWNGAGTTTNLSVRTNIRSIGFDLNPVMVIVSKANLIVSHEASSITPLTEKILQAAKNNASISCANPLNLYFSSQTSGIIKAIARSIWDHLVSLKSPQSPHEDMDKVAPLAAAFYVGLFNTVRESLASFSTSNPTWIKTPKNDSEKLNISFAALSRHYIMAMTRIEKLAAHRQTITASPHAQCNFGDAKRLPLENESVESILTSPPYCTRLDYARATLPELLTLESINLANHIETRTALMGSSVVKKPEDSTIPENWGVTCQNLMAHIYDHPSKASKSYYFNSHYFYFKDLYDAISEIGRVTRPKAKICLVAQDSYYKEIHNDLSKIIIEMAEPHGISLFKTFPYLKKNSIKLINKASSQYNSKTSPIETAILFIKE